MLVSIWKWFQQYTDVIQADVIGKYSLIIIIFNSVNCLLLEVYHSMKEN